MYSVLEETSILISRMPDPLPIFQVKIVGYANKLTESMLPTVVPPVFRSIANPDHFFLPPYVLKDGHLWSDQKRDARELRQLEERGDVTLFAEPPLEAKPDYELWIDSENQRHYESNSDAEEALQAIAEQCISEAEEALKTGDYTTAKNATRKAMCANDRLIEPLAIRAAIAQKENELGQLNLMFHLVGSRSTKAGFKLMVAGYEEILASATTCARPAADLFTCHPMHNIALQRAA
ncbi:hypothetical protein [Prosthecobacter sp.]|uniref:hypothetical protein n=1 Tax=Prosthecobacter sp. TaxID=1965333 RepID=UPI0024870A2A|nr:hypothetical protein [Prosthecobacter sp.]MDI1310563.1 hypothetical protein [Prosthecobacter sp.]